MFSSILTTLSNCFKIPELKSRIVFTLLVLAICRLACLVPVPGLNSGLLKDYFDHNGGNNVGGVLGMYSLFTGGGFENCAVGALGIMPYISATIILQLLQAVVPFLSKLSREEGGRAKLIKYSRFGTLVLCIGQGFVMAIGWEHAGDIFKGLPGSLVVIHNIWVYRIQTTVILTTGTMLLMWLGEQITDRGIGNGISLIITINILARLPAAGQGLVDMFLTPGALGEHRYNAFHFIALILLLCAVVAGVVAVTQAERKIPVQYAQRVVGRKTYSGGSSFMPLRVNYSGVMPVIFASAILMFPTMILNFLGSRFHVAFFDEVAQMLQTGSFLYLLLYGLMILFFSYFWVATQFNELQISDDMKKSGGYIPGVRPGQATSNFLHRTMSRITLAGAIFLTIIAVIPILLGELMNIPPTVAQFFGGTSLLIIVGVMLDTMRQMESHLLMRHYDGFLKKGRLKGRF
ncbi:MAG TPA: preprotein translocase subunit SecY [Candidatus Saccharimonadales bacterium]|nr:preprotein translocase subunit SecY [Candidatus Saccharimonadales bacterium]